MEKEIIERIIKELDVLKDEQIFLLIILLLVFVLANIVQAVYTSRLVEKYRNELRKKEIKFTALNELQLKKLSTLFELISNIKSSTAQIYNGIKNGIGSEIIETNYSESYQYFSNFCHLNRYAFPKNIKKAIKDNNKIVKDLNYNIMLLNKKILIENEFAHSPENDEQIAIIDSQIENYNFESETLQVMKFGEELRNLIDEYFEKLE